MKTEKKRKKTDTDKQAAEHSKLGREEKLDRKKLKRMQKKSYTEERYRQTDNSKRSKDIENRKIEK